MQIKLSPSVSAKLSRLKRLASSMQAKLVAPFR
jgi:hypothetical protein